MNETSNILSSCQALSGTYLARFRDLLKCISNEHPQLAPENINVTCEPISGHVRTKGSEVFESFQAETRNDAMKYNKSESIT